MQSYIASSENVSVCLACSLDSGTPEVPEQTGTGVQVRLEMGPGGGVGIQQLLQ